MAFLGGLFLASGKGSLKTGFLARSYRFIGCGPEVFAGQTQNLAKAFFGCLACQSIFSIRLAFAEHVHINAVIFEVVELVERERFKRGSG
jgi:hypothetical protein